MRYLVTGGAGFIGSNLTEKLLSMGHEVVVVDNESSGSHARYYWNPKAENYKIDINCLDKILPLFKNIDAVFHMAAVVNIQESIKNPFHAFQTNQIGTLNVLEAAKAHGVKKVVYSSTSSYYGNVNPIPSKENYPENSLNPYSISKANGEKMCLMYNDLYGMKNIVFRYFNAYGKNYPTVGQYVPVIGIFLENLKNKLPLKIVGDGLQRRDFVNVEDIVSANVSTLSAAEDSNVFTFNIGSGNNYSILDIANSISSNILHVEDRPGEIRNSLSDISLAKEHLHWEPKIDIFSWIKGQVEEIEAARKSTF
jgi:UDP-glucose 4-epimerase